MIFQDDDTTPVNDDNSGMTQGGSTSSGSAQDGSSTSDVDQVIGGPLGGSQSSQPVDETQYVIPDEVREKYGELVELIIQTESMNDDERNYWFQTLLIMNEEQVKNLYQILATEKQNLAAIDEKAQQEMNKLNEKQVAEWKEFEEKERKKMIQDAESQSEQQEAEAEQELLDELDQL